MRESCPAPRAQRRRDHKRLVALGLICGAALLAGCDQQDRRKDAKLPVKAQPVRFVPYAPKAALSGEVVARVQSELSFRVSGQIVERKVDVASHVQAGDELARLDPKLQEADVEGATAAVQAADAKLRQVAASFERQKKLIAQGWTTQRDYDQAEQEQRSAAAALDGAKAQLATARDQLAQTVLRAPSAGVITARTIEIGQVAQPGQSVFSLALDGPRDAVVNVQESLFAGGLGGAVEVALVSDPAIGTTGEVREISPAVNATGAVRVKIHLLHPPPQLALGSTVRVALQAQARQMAVLPSSALYADGVAPAVWVLDPASRTVALRRIEIESYGNADVILRAGLRPGEWVVTSGVQLLRPAQQVAVVGEPQ